MKTKKLCLLFCIVFLISIWFASTGSIYAQEPVNRLARDEDLTYLLTDEGRVLAFGLHYLPSDVGDYIYFGEDTGLEDIVSIYNSVNGVVAKQASGAVYKWSHETDYLQVKEEITPYEGELIDPDYSIFPNNFPGPQIYQYVYGNTEIALCYDGSVWINGEFDHVFDLITEVIDGVEYVYESWYTVNLGKGWQEKTEFSQNPTGFEVPEVETKTISASDYTFPHTIVMRSDLALAAGYGNSGQLGHGYFASENTPKKMNCTWDGFSGQIHDIKEVSAGNQYSLVLKEDGTVWGTGFNEYNKLGIALVDGNAVNVSKLNQVKGEGGNGWLTDIVQVSAGKRHSMALKKDGTVWVWGSSSNGQLGLGDRNMCLFPVRVPGLTQIIAVAAGNDTSMALKADGTVYMWGKNEVGQLGDGTTEDRWSPVIVKGQDGIGELENIIAIDTSDKLSMALDSNGNVWTWGSNEYGQLGHGASYVQSTTPDTVKDNQGNEIENITAISAGDAHAAANGDYFWSWGRNNHGQLGVGNHTDTNYAVETEREGMGGPLYNVKAFSCGNQYTIAELTNGRILAWGYDNMQFGNGGSSSSSSPVNTQFTNF